jgi:hypothetical protein
MEQAPDGSTEPQNVAQRDEEMVAAFCRKLDAFAEQLSDQERLALGGLVFRAMGPLDRFRLANSSDVLTDEEKRVLRSLSGVDGD